MPEHTVNYGLIKQLPGEFYDRELDNQNLDTIDGALKALEDSKIEIIVTQENIPIESRKNGSFYFIVTDSAPTPPAQNILVSPTMGLKKVEE